MSENYSFLNDIPGPNQCGIKHQNWKSQMSDILTEKGKYSDSLS